VIGVRNAVIVLTVRRAQESRRSPLSYRGCSRGRFSLSEWTHSWLRCHPRRQPPVWDRLSLRRRGGDGRPFSQFEHAWYQGLAAVAREDVGIIIDEVFLGGRESQDRLSSPLGGLRVVWVGVRCDLEVDVAREVARPERTQGMASSQAMIVHEGCSTTSRWIQQPTPHWSGQSPSLLTSPIADPLTVLLSGLALIAELRTFGRRVKFHLRAHLHTPSRPMTSPSGLVSGDPSCGEGQVLPLYLANFSQCTSAWSSRVEYTDLLTLHQVVGGLSSAMSPVCRQRGCAVVVRQVRRGGRRLAKLR
jgi:hypothetical protein